MDPYCKITLGHQKISGEVCRNGGKHPHWEDTLVLRTVDEPIFEVEVKEKDWLLPDAVIGVCQVSFKEFEDKIRVLKWFPLAFENKSVGRLLLEVTYESDHPIRSKVDKIPSQQQNSQSALTVITNLPAAEIKKSKPQEGQAPKGFLQGLIHGWTPFGLKGQKNQSESSQASQVVQVPNQQIQVSNAQSEPLFNNLNQNNHIQQSQQENTWALAYSQNSQNPQNGYPQKYPQFSPSESSNNNLGYHRAYYPDQENNPQGAKEQYNSITETIDYRNRQANTLSRQAADYTNNYDENNCPSQNYQEINNNRVDPLRVIRGL